MNDKQRIVWSMMAGAFVGAAAGFLLFTEKGRRLRDEIQPHLDEMVTEMGNLRDLTLRVRETATEGWRQVENMVNQFGHQGAQWVEEARRH